MRDDLCNNEGVFPYMDNNRTVSLFANGRTVVFSPYLAALFVRIKH